MQSVPLCLCAFLDTHSKEKSRKCSSEEFFLSELFGTTSDLIRGPLPLDVEAESCETLLD